MVSRVIYRPFEEGDFDALAAILQATWHSESPNEAYNRLEATYDLAHALSISSFSQVVLVDGEPRGIVLARAESDRLPYAAAWDHAKQETLQQMLEIDERATSAYLAFLKSEARVNGKLLRESGISGTDQITLLAVSETTRGMGIGSVLLDAAAHARIGSLAPRSRPRHEKGPVRGLFRCGMLSAYACTPKTAACMPASSCPQDAGGP